MIKIYIKKAQTCQNIASLQDLIRDSWQLKEVLICRNPSQPLTPMLLRSAKNWPFHATFDVLGSDEQVELYISNIEVGSCNSQSQDTVELLDVLNISYDAEDILTKCKMGEDGSIRLSYKRDEEGYICLTSIV